MFVAKLTTANPEILLVEPDVARDAPLGVGWLAGPAGRETLRLMGVNVGENVATTLAYEQRRVQAFLDRDDQYNWMIELRGRVVGSVWVERDANDHLESPSLHIMLGDPAARGAGVGPAAMQAAIEFLCTQGHTKFYSRHLIENTRSAGMLRALGFTDLEEPYTDEDGLRFQNVILS